MFDGIIESPSLPSKIPYLGITWTSTTIIITIPRLPRSCGVRGTMPASITTLGTGGHGSSNLPTFGNYIPRHCPEGRVPTISLARNKTGKVYNLHTPYSKKCFSMFGVVGRSDGGVFGAH